MRVTIWLGKVEEAAISRHTSLSGKEKEKLLEKEQAMDFFSALQEYIFLEVLQEAQLSMRGWTKALTVLIAHFSDSELIWATACQLPGTSGGGSGALMWPRALGQYPVFNLSLQCCTVWWFLKMLLFSR